MKLLKISLAGISLAIISQLATTAIPLQASNLSTSNKTHQLDINAYVNDVYQQINNYRATKNLAPLQINQVLEIAANAKAQNMIDKQYFAHTSPQGLSPWYWFTTVGYKYQKAGENLALNYYDSEQVTQAWLTSQTHRQNIEKKEYTETGIGIVSGQLNGHNTIFIVQLFAQPQTPKTFANKKHSVK